MQLLDSSDTTMILFYDVSSELYFEELCKCWNNLKSYFVQITENEC